MKKYDAIFILNDRKFEDGGTAYAEKITELIKSLSGTEITHKSMGRKQFARPIGKRTSGLYWRFFFTMPTANVKEFMDKFRLEESVLRHVVHVNDIPETPKVLDLTNV
ncbi:MAG: ribosomal protein [Verrucomicrobiota bacterium]|jgi:ribosomal protein S6